MDTDNELFDAACELLIAARRMEDAADAPDLASAVPATVGCLEATLAALTSVVEHLERELADAPAHALEALEDALRRARRVCAATRGAVGDTSMEAPR